MKKEIQTLQSEMKKEGFAAYLIPTSDPHMSEYVADHFKERAYISGFTGSAGTLLITGDSAFLWTDGRYFLQAEKELAGSGIVLMKQGEPGVFTLQEYLRRELKDGDVLAFDGRTLSSAFVKRLKRKLPGVSFCMHTNLTDRIWKARPLLLQNPVFSLDLSVTGKSRSEKLSLVRKELKEKGVKATFLTSLDDIAWLLNLRGSDVHCNLVFLSYLYLSEKEAVLFAADKADEEKKVILSKAIRKELKEDGVRVLPYEEAYAYAEALRNESILIDEESVNACLCEKLTGANRIISGENPSFYLKAVKNETELKNMRDAHRKDGVALTKLIYRLKCYRDDPASVPLTERSVAALLTALRKEQGGYLSESFDPIIAYGEHGAVIHYSASEESDVPIGRDSLLLMDTGAHYETGTTDVTRTISMARPGELSYDMKRHYTLVLKSHLALLSAKFPEGVSGNSLDALAREPLWREGLDFNHGTGHGVGYLLSVHEGPNAFRTLKGNRTVLQTPMEPGMITSDEPGLYFAGKYGIRTESLLECVKEENGFCGFRPLTMVPFDRECVAFDLLNEEETRLFFDYQELVYDTISSYMTKEEQAWLKKTVIRN